MDLITKNIYDSRQLTITEIIDNTKEMNSGTMHEVDQLTYMVDTQRSIIRLLQEEIKKLKENK